MFDIHLAVLAAQLLHGPRFVPATAGRAALLRLGLAVLVVALAVAALELAGRH